MGNNIYLGFSEKNFVPLKVLLTAIEINFPLKFLKKNFNIKGNITSNIKCHRHKTNLLKL